MWPTISDVLDELRAENDRLSGELVFANKCLHVLLKFKHYFYKNYLNVNNSNTQCYQTINESLNAFNRNNSDYDLKELENEFDVILRENKEKMTRILSDNNIIENNAQNSNEIKSEENIDSGDELTAILTNLNENTRIVNAIISGQTIDKNIAENNDEIKTQEIEDIRDELSTKVCDTERDTNNRTKLRKTAVSYCKNGVNVKERRVCGLNGDHLYAKKNCEIKSGEKINKNPLKRGLVLPKHKTKQTKTRNELKCDWNECDFVTKDRIRLLWHKNRHLGVKPFKCSKSGCDKAFYSRQKMWLHKRLVHETKSTIPCEWPECKSTFKTQSTLNKHMKNHRTPVEERPYVCEVSGCSYRAVSKQYMDKHQFTHSTHKPFKCAECGKAFKFEHCLNSHIRVHNIDLQFKCDFPDCHVSYAFAKYLKRHKQRVHENIDLKVYRCDWPVIPYIILMNVLFVI